jgi:hypothetical protein
MGNCIIVTKNGRDVIRFYTAGAHRHKGASVICTQRHLLVNNEVFYSAKGTKARSATNKDVKCLHKADSQQDGYDLKILKEQPE